MLFILMHPHSGKKLAKLMTFCGFKSIALSTNILKGAKATPNKKIKAAASIIAGFRTYYQAIVAK